MAVWRNGRQTGSDADELTARQVSVTHRQTDVKEGSQSVETGRSSGGKTGRQLGPLGRRPGGGIRVDGEKKAERQKHWVGSSRAEWQEEKWRNRNADRKDIIWPCLPSFLVKGGEAGGMKDVTETPGVIRRTEYVSKGDSWKSLQEVKLFPL